MRARRNIQAKKTTPVTAAVQPIPIPTPAPAERLEGNVGWTVGDVDGRILVEEDVDRAAQVAAVSTDHHNAVAVVRELTD